MHALMSFCFVGQRFRQGGRVRPGGQEGRQGRDEGGQDEDGGLDWGKVGTALALAAILLILGCCLR
jgi:hypothetical protein